MTDCALEFDHVDILFTRARGAHGKRALRQGLAALDAGQTRAQILEQCGVMVGVADAGLRVEGGQICVLMGLSGSGKSTLLRAANGLNPVTRGRVLVHDGDTQVDVAQCTSESLRRLRRRRIAMVFQQFGLLPWRSVRDNVGFGLELRGEPAAQRARVVDEKLELVGLSQWADRHVGELSGGMQQRVGLARAFATDADILLMDEPFSALDPLIRTKLQDELLELQARVRKTIVFVSHDLDEALRLGNQISILEGGRILQTGSVRDIVLRPAHARVAEFVQHMNPLDSLRGDMVMRRRADLSPAHAGNGLCLDADGHYVVELDSSGRATGVRRDGQPLAAICTAPATTTVQQLIELCVRSGHPVLLEDAQGFCGSCGETEIMRALAGTRGGPQP